VPPERTAAIRVPFSLRTICILRNNSCQAAPREKGQGCSPHVPKECCPSRSQRTIVSPLRKASADISCGGVASKASGFISFRSCTKLFSQ